MLHSFLETFIQEKISIIFKEINYYNKTTNLYKFKLMISFDKKFFYFFHETSYGLHYLDYSSISLNENSDIADFKNQIETKAREIILSFNKSGSSSTYSMVHFGI